MVGLTISAFIESFESACISVGTMFTTLPGGWDTYMDEYPQWRTNTMNPPKHTTTPLHIITTATETTTVDPKTAPAPPTILSPSDPITVTVKSSDRSSFYPNEVTVKDMTDPQPSELPRSSASSSTTIGSPSSDSNSDPPSSHDNKSAASFGTTRIAGTAAGATIGIALAIAASVFFVRRRRQNQPEIIPVTPHEIHHVQEGKAEFGGQSGPRYYTAPGGVCELDSNSVCELDGNGIHNSRTQA